jgi:hypothetical protein
MKFHLLKANHSDLGEHVETIAFGLCNCLEEREKERKFDFMSKVIISVSPQNVETTNYLIHNWISSSQNVKNSHLDIPFDMGLKLLSDDTEIDDENLTKHLFQRRRINLNDVSESFIEQETKDASIPESK